MKLELKHLAAYFPYGLKIQLLRTEYFGNYRDYRLSSYSDYPVSFSVSESVQYAAMLSEIKPILRPLSDLTKEIEINGEKILPLVELHRIKNNGDWIGVQNRNKSIEENPYWVIQKLLEWHFDIFELIPNNLAIDINTITNA